MQPIMQSRTELEFPWETPQSGDRGKILLLYPVTGMDLAGVNVGLPLACLYLGTVLEKVGYRVQIVDERLTNRFGQEVAESILRERPVLVGGSSMTGMQIRGGLEGARAVRSVDPSVPVVWGGVHPSLCPDSTLKNELCDIVVVGEGEITLVELADCLASGGDMAQVHGIGFEREGKIHFTPGRTMIEELDRIPRPDYGLVDMQHYFTTAPTTLERQLQVVTSRGCPYDCEFCYNLKFNERRFRYHSAGRTVSDIAHLVGEFGVRAIFVEDDYFFGNPRRVEEICNLLLKENLDLLIQVPCRIDYLDRQQPEMIDKLYRAGFKELWIGIESGSEKRLKEIMKRNTLDQVRAVNQLLARSEVYAKFGFMAGFPNEERWETLETVDFMFELAAHNPNAGLAPVAIYTPYPGTTLYDKARFVYGMEPPDSLEGWSRFHFAHNNNPFLSDRQKKFISKVNVMSRFFERKAFERFSQNRFKPLLMFLFDLYYRYLRVRLHWRFFSLMPEIPLIRLLEKVYLKIAHRSQVSRMAS